MKLYIYLSLNLEPYFINPKCQKKKLWQQVAKEFKKSSGQSITGVQCDVKYRNLLITYRANKKKQNSLHGGEINWEFFDL